MEKNYGDVKFIFKYCTRIFYDDGIQRWNDFLSTVSQRCIGVDSFDQLTLKYRRIKVLSIFWAHSDVS